MVVISDIIVQGVQMLLVMLLALGHLCPSVGADGGRASEVWVRALLDGVDQPPERTAFTMSRTARLDWAASLLSSMSDWCVESATVR